jgi:two-component system cell cycle sensor histidine kinase/response regulator CckA
MEMADADRTLTFLAAAIDQAPASVMLMDATGRIAYVNAVFSQITGFTREEAHGATPDILRGTPPDGSFDDSLREAIGSGRDWRGRITGRHKGGTTFVLDLKVAPVRDQGGAVIGFVAIGENAEERLLAEEAVCVSEERLSQAVHASKVGIFDHDHRNDTAYWSPEARQLLGWPAEGNVNVSDLTPRVHPQDRERVIAAVRRAHDPAGDGVYQVEYRLDRGDGAVHWISARSQTLFEGEGERRRPRRTVGALLELTERKRVEEELREATRVVLESQRVARLGSYRLDAPSGTWTCSPVLDELLGITDPSFPRDVAGWLAIVHPDDRDELGDHLLKNVLAGRQPFDRHYRIVRVNDGAVRWVHGRGQPVADDEGRVVELIGTIQDVTERKQAEAERARVEELLVQSQRMEAIGRLAGGVAHDFNNLLSVIRGHGERLLQGMREDAGERGRVEQIVWAADKGGSLTRQLLAFSRRQVLAPRVIRLDAVVAEAVKLLERVIGEDVELLVAAPDHLSSVRADPGQMVQVLLNLAVNSRDAMPGGGRLTLECADVELDAGRYVMMAVSDTGHGMDAETRRRAFEPFFTTKEPGKGTGLGLSTVYGIVEQSGGLIRVDSTVGVGTTFRVYLPRVDGAPEVPFQSRVAAAQSPGRPGGQILLVEDDDGVRELMGDVLEVAGYEVSAHARGEAALAAAESLTIDLLVTDVIMPGMSGGELAKRLEERQPGVRVLFVSGYAGEALARQACIRRGERFLQKPFREQELLDMVAATLADETGTPGRQ